MTFILLLQIMHLMSFEPTSPSSPLVREEKPFELLLIGSFISTKFISNELGFEGKLFPDRYKG